MVILGIFISALELAQNFCLLGYIISEYIFFLSHTFQFNIFFTVWKHGYQSFLKIHCMVLFEEKF